MKRHRSADADIHVVHQEWDEVLCPICMDHPHNAVLLLCTSHEKGCRSYICDTSYRHSNCLDRFRKLRTDSKDNSSPQFSSSVNPRSSGHTSSLDLNLTASIELREGHENYNVRTNNGMVSAQFPVVPGEHGDMDTDGTAEVRDTESTLERISFEQLGSENSSRSRLGLKCPLCRGFVLGWKIEEEARRYLNLKSRSCSSESCSFCGNYQELRRHARRVHPTSRPAEVDPLRQQVWQRLERQRERADIINAIRAAMPGAIVFGDYIIENGERPSIERGNNPAEENQSSWTTLYLFQMIDSIEQTVESSGPSRGWTRHRPSTGASSDHRYLWGENLLGIQNDNNYEDSEEDNDDNDDDSNASGEWGEDILQWLFKITNEEQERETLSSLNNNKQEGIDAKLKDIVLSKHCGTKQRSKRAESLRFNSKNPSTFSILFRRGNAKACFYSTLNLKRLGSIRHQGKVWIHCMKMKEEDVSNGANISHKTDASAHGGNKVLPISDTTPSSSSSSTGSNEQCEPSDRKSRFKGDKTKAISRMKELIRWAAAAKAEKGGKYITRKVLYFKNRGTLKAVPDEDQLSNESPKISLRWDVGSCSTSSSVYSSFSAASSFKHYPASNKPSISSTSIHDLDLCSSTRAGNWITTDSESLKHILLCSINCSPAGVFSAESLED
ncbi:Protein of unknown function DUF1644 [Dillenia turbinata]|uniref:Uncharacterized protein n=1 Tax=Dillenia turbinata TaxID=194707 RepID=A0AAN8ZGY3_9MAGN